jgi:predicted secreted protein
MVGACPLMVAASKRGDGMRLVESSVFVEGIAGATSGAMARSLRPRWTAADARGGRVVFVSHCLLNENVRYPGGATCPGAVPEVVQRYLADGIGLCQMTCPEQRAWGGVRKRHLLRLYGRRSLRWPLVRRPVLAVATAWTRLVYRRLARRVAHDIAGYLRSALEVVEVVGVGGSPSCGVHTTLDLDRAVAAMARVDAVTDVWSANRSVVIDNVVAGRGLFIECLDRALARRGIRVAQTEHDLVAELTRARVTAPAGRCPAPVTGPASGARR